MSITVSDIEGKEWAEGYKAGLKDSVIHAHWISHDDDGLYHECSNCGVHDYWNTSNVYIMFDYCPDCGAKMDEEV